MAETAAGMREQILRQCNSAGLDAYERGDRAAAAAYYRQGLEHAATFLAAGETAAGVREQVLWLYYNARINASNLNLLNLARHYQLLDQALRWAWGRSSIPPAVADLFVDRDLITLMPETQVLPLWREALETWLLRCHGPTLPQLPLAELSRLIRCAETLLLLDHAHNNDRFQSLFKQLLHHQAGIEQPVAAWRETQGALATRIRRNLKRLRLDSEPPEPPEAFIQATRQALADLSPWWRWWHGWSAYRIRQALTSYERVLKNPPRLSQALWRDIERGQNELATWLAERVHEVPNLPSTLSTSSEAALGILLAGQAAEPAVTVARWLKYPPWDTAATLTAPLDATRWPDWVHRFAPEDTTRAALYGWTGMQQHHQRLVIAGNLHNHPEPVLDQALRAFAAGDAAPLQQLLSGAWVGAKDHAGKLAWTLQAFAGAGSDEIPEVIAAARATIPPPAEHYPAALAAVLLGDSKAQLTTVVRAWLDRLLPLEPEANLPGTLSRLKERFARVLTTCPQPPDPVALRERLHAWSRQALGLALTEPKPDLDYLWNNLERARLALTGLTIDAPSEQWTEETTKGLHQALQTSLTPMPPSNTPWPPLHYWLEQVSRIIPPLPDVTICRQRLQADEALAQLFFDPNTGDLKALWLTQGQALQQRCFPAASRYDFWSASGGKDGILARWIAWFQQGEHTLALQDLWSSVMDSAPVRSVAATLSEWARQARLQRLCVLFPAELAQLPWEALNIFDPEHLILERAVSLTHWRAPPRAPSKSEEPVPPAIIAYAQRDPSVAYGRREAEQAGNYWHSPVEHNATAFDVMARLQQRPHGHLIMHGQYVAHNPYLSHLKLSSTDHLYAWTFGALDLQGHLGLSACQATLSGQQAEHLLGPVGLGPALVAAGARRVIGPLWNCDQLAS
ncbi:MAG: CHAT domain-containing protein [Candidatus Competibacteraceae bacterium]